MTIDSERLNLLWIGQAIRRTKARFVRAADTGDADLLGSVLTSDVSIDFTEAGIDPQSGFSFSSPATEKPIRGREAAVAQICGALSGMVNIHLLGEPEIEVSGDRTASGIWPVADHLFLPPGHPIAELSGFGHYHETYREEDGVWRIASLKLARLRFQAISSGSPAS